jgi:hypothetical protein
MFAATAEGTARLLLADEGKAYPFFELGLYLSGALIVGALIMVALNRWRKKADVQMTASDQLAQFRSMYEKGQIDQEEFEKLRRVLGGELRRQVKSGKEAGEAAPPPAGPAAPEGSPPAGPEPPPAPDDGVRPA